MEGIEQSGELRQQDWKCGLPADRLEGRRLRKSYMDRRTAVGERFRREIGCHLWEILLLCVF